MNKKTYYISEVAAKYNIHPQTLRLYEREGLLIPTRTKGNTRVYTDKDLKRLESILSLSRDMGVNLAGIEIILNMKEKMELMQEEFSRFIEELKKEFFEGREDVFDRKKNAIVKSSSSSVVVLSNEKRKE